MAKTGDSNAPIFAEGIELYRAQTRGFTVAYSEIKAAIGADVLEAENVELASQVHTLELQCQKLTMQRNEKSRDLKKLSDLSRKRSLLVWVLSTGAMIISGIGINFVSGSNEALFLPGWIMIVVALALMGLDFCITRWRE